MQNVQVRRQARVAIIVLALGCFLGGAMVGGFVLYRAIHRPTIAAPVPGGIQLSAGTKAVLRGLKAPVDVHFYALLDPATVSSALQAFAARADQLVSTYERDGQGKIVLTRSTSNTDPAAADAATADGIRPFNREKGEVCFLGIAVACQGRKEALAELSPEWESALESDLTRAIARVSAPPPSTGPAPQTPKTSEAAIQEVKHLVPNLASVSVEDGVQIIREAAMKDFQAAANEGAAQLKQAQQRLAEAQNTGSDADRQAAMKFLQQVQANQTEKLRQIAARTQAQIQALKQLKSATP